MKKFNIVSGVLEIALGILLITNAQAQNFSAEQIKLGSDTYARHCSPCHGARMKNPEGAFDLPTFPKDQKSRFLNSVGKGKNSMPPWDGLLKPDEIEALWAYVYTGDNN